MLLALLAHEKLLDFEAARVPPGDADEKGIRASASREAGGFRIEEKPLRGLAHFFGRSGSEQAERRRIDFVFRRVQCEAVSDGFREPPAQAEVFAEAIASGRGAQNFGEAVGARGNVGRESTRRIASLGSERHSALAWAGLERLEPI